MASVFSKHFHNENLCKYNFVERQLYDKFLVMRQKLERNGSERCKTEGKKKKQEQGKRREERSEVKEEKGMRINYKTRGE